MCAHNSSERPCDSLAQSRHHPCRHSTAGLTVGTRRRQRDPADRHQPDTMTDMAPETRPHAAHPRRNGARAAARMDYTTEQRESIQLHTATHGGMYDTVGARGLLRATVDATVSEGAPRPLPPPRRLACSRRRPAVGSRRARHRDLVVDGRGSHISWLEGGKPGEGAERGRMRTDVLHTPVASVTPKCASGTSSARRVRG